MKFRRLLIIGATLVTAIAYAAPAYADTPVSLSEAYRQIKDAERSIPIPTPSATISMGGFNAATGEFDGLATETIIINGKPVRLVPSVTVNAVNARLSFSIVPSTKSVRLAVTGVGSTTVLAGRTSIAMDIGRLHDVHWSLTSGTKVHRDDLTIKRPRTIGAGAFTIPALPVAVVYDSPQNPEGTNSVVYTRSTSVGTTLGMTVRQANSTTSPGISPDFPEVGIFHSQLQAIQSFAQVTGNSLTATQIGKIDSLLGKATRNVTTSNDATSSKRRTYTFTESHTCSTDSGVFHLGPGRSDRIAYLRNVRMVWLDNGTQTFVQVLGYDSFECPTIDQLRSGVADLPAAAANPLIALDPFTGLLGAQTPLAGDPRFAQLPGIGLLPDDLVQTASYAQQIMTQNTQVETSTRVVTDDMGAGLLSLIGLAPSQSGQASSTLSVANESGTTDSTTVQTTLTARTLLNGVRTELAVFYDRVFGNIAFKAV